MGGGCGLSGLAVEVSLTQQVSVSLHMLGPGRAPSLEWMVGLWGGWAAWEPGQESLLGSQGLDGAGVLAVFQGRRRPGALGRGEEKAQEVTPRLPAV